MEVKRPQTAYRLDNCIINDETLDIIPESDHYNRQCICFMCTCGKHNCPAIKTSFYTKNSLATNYQMTFKKPQTQSPPQRVRSSYSPNPHKMNCITTKMHDFKTPVYNEAITIHDENLINKRLKFSGRSKYQSDFPC